MAAKVYFYRRKTLGKVRPVLDTVSPGSRLDKGRSLRIVGAVLELDLAAHEGWSLGDYDTAYPAEMLAKAAGIAPAQEEGESE